MSFIKKLGLAFILWFPFTATAITISILRAYHPILYFKLVGIWLISTLFGSLLLMERKPKTGALPKYRCKKCGREFNTRYALGGHGRKCK
jgi:hypothetical protein